MTLKDKKILILDDSRAFLAGIKSLLSSTDCVILDFLESKAALDCLGSAEVDVIIVDLEMPTISGIEFTKQIRAMERLNEIPVLLLTGKEDATTMNEALFSGADGFAGKSSVRQTLVAQLMAMIRLRELNRAVGKSKQLEAVKALIGTYKHEFGNALTIVDGKLRNIERVHPELTDNLDYQGMKSCLDRVKGVLKNLDALSSIEQTNYHGPTKILKVS